MVRDLRNLPRLHPLAFFETIDFTFFPLNSILSSVEQTLRRTQLSPFNLTVSLNLCLRAQSYKSVNDKKKNFSFPTLFPFASDFIENALKFYKIKHWIICLFKKVIKHIVYMLVECSDLASPIYGL